MRFTHEGDIIHGYVIGGIGGAPADRNKWLLYLTSSQNENKKFVDKCLALGPSRFEVVKDIKVHGERCGCNIGQIRAAELKTQFSKGKITQLVEHTDDEGVLTIKEIAEIEILKGLTPLI